MPEYYFTGLIAVIVAVIEALAAKDRKRVEKARKAEAAAAAEREKAREKIMVQLINSSNAAIALGEATARAVQRIPDSITVGLGFSKGELGWRGGKVYESLLDGNVWTPEAYPAGWRLIGDPN